MHWQLFKLDSCIIFNGFNKRINSKTQTYVTYAFNIYYVAATILTGTYHCVHTLKKNEIFDLETIRT